MGQTDQKKQEQNQEGAVQDTGIAADDLNLVDDRLEDESKDDAELWAELEQDENPAATDDPQAQAPGDDEPGSEGEGDAAAAGDDQGSDDQGSATSGDGEGEPSPTQGQSDGDEPSDGARQQPDLWASATPEQRAAFEAAAAERKKLEQADRSNRGRISALQRQLNDLQRQQTQQPAAAAAGEGTQDEGADGFLASDDWKEFAGEYPEVAGPLGKVVGALQAQNTRLEKELNAIGGDRRQQALDEQATLLAEAHPDWREVAGVPEFGEWLETQPRHIREAAFRNAEEIVDAEEAADVVGRFKASREQGAERPGNEPSGSAKAGQGTQNNRLAGKRQRQLESASAARSRGPGVASGIAPDGDPEKIWDQFDEMERRQARA